MSRTSIGQSEEDSDMVDGAVVGRIMKVARGARLMCTLAFGHHEDRTPTHGYAAGAG